jgi:pyrimidine deaminase RibD-like protein
MRLALSLSRLSPRKPTNYRVGAVLLSRTTNTLLSSSYTLELPGNTHAEQNCLTKLCLRDSLPESRVAEAFPAGEEVVLYTTMEPCVRRLSGNVSCVERILGTGIKRVFVGVKEPEVFVGGNEGRRLLEDGGVEVVHVHGLEEEILEVAMAGHEGRAGEAGHGGSGSGGGGVVVVGGSA